MLKRLYTLFIIIAMTASSTIKAEETVYPTLTKQGGTYELVTSTEQIVDGGVYLFAGTMSSHLQLMSTLYVNSDNTLQRFSSIQSNRYSTLENSIIVDNVNDVDCPYEYVFKKKDDSFEFKFVDIKGKCVKNIRTLGMTNNNVAVNLVSEDEEEGVFFTPTKHKENGNRWNFKNTNELGQVAYFCDGCNSNKSQFFFTCSNTENIFVSLYKKVTSSPTPPSPTTEQFTMSSVGYATLYYGTKDVTLPEGLTANTYTLNETQEKVYLTPSHTYNAGDVIPAGVAVVVKGNAGDYNLTISDPAESPEEYDNVLKGYDTDTQLTEKANTCYYKLSINSAGDLNSVGFYWGADNGGSFTTLAHKAYLELSADNQDAKQLVSILDPEGGNTTGMSEIKMQHKGDAEYDLGGMKTSKSVNGIKIKNGKKYFVIVK